MMLTKRKLRNRVALLEKENENAKKKGKFTTMCNFYEKENHLANSNNTGVLKDDNNKKSVYPSTLKKSRSKLIRNNVDEPNNKVACNEICSEVSEKENINERSCRKKSVKKSYPDQIKSSCDNLPKKKMKGNIKDITLFESPTKQQKKNKIKFPKKPLCINLFNDVLSTPPRELNLEDSVLKPNKAYHTPDNFKTHLVCMKRTAGEMKKAIKKSKEDILIEKMTKHFDEIDDTQLCIE